MTNLILIYFFGEGGGRFFVFKFKLGFFIFHLVYTSGSSIHLTWQCIFKDYSRSLKCLFKSTFPWPVWLLGANNQKRGRIFGHRHYTKKNLFVRINVDISSVLTNAGRRFLSPYVKHL